jgi:hypothetical protein
MEEHCPVISSGLRSMDIFGAEVYSHRGAQPGLSPI